MSFVDCSRERAKQGKKLTNYKLPPKAEVVSYDGKTYCILEIDMKTGVRDLLLKDAETFED